MKSYPTLTWSRQAPWLVGSQDSAAVSSVSALLHVIEESYCRNILVGEQDWIFKFLHDCLDAAHNTLYTCEIPGCQWILRPGRNAETEECPLLQVGRFAQLDIATQASMQQEPAHTITWGTHQRNHSTSLLDRERPHSDKGAGEYLSDT